MNTREPLLLKEMNREIDAMRAGKAATDEESLARAVKITALEEYMGGREEEGCNGVQAERHPGEPCLSLGDGVARSCLV